MQIYIIFFDFYALNKKSNPIFCYCIFDLSNINMLNSQCYDRAWMRLMSSSKVSLLIARALRRER